ncbi:MAG: OpgC domain-containing protein [Actinomycetota bacterium]|nr:OpgC domain-containing protein [Actinomycetota bacterium]
MALDLVRGLAIVVLVINHIHLESPLELGTRAPISAAEVLVLVSGAVVGMVFGRRWLGCGARATARLLLHRSVKLYLAALAVVALVSVLTVVPGLATEVLTVSPRRPDRDLYAFDGALPTLVAIVTLEAGPWQFNILGFFVAALAAAPVVLWALDRRGWPLVLLTSWGLYLLGRAWTADVLPSQSERPFPLLVWQVLFVHGMVLGWYRERIDRVLRARPGAVAALGVLFLAVALAGTAVRLRKLGLDPLGLDALLGLDGREWARWQREHFSKTLLDPARIAAMVSATAALYLGLRRLGPLAERALGPVLLPFGRNSFYVFIMHVFVCLGVASVPRLAGDGLDPVGNTIVQLGCLALLWAMVRTGFLFRWVPR